MVDSILIQNDLAHEIWRATAKVNVPPLHPDLVAQIVEQPEGVVQENWLWDGTNFSAPPPPDPVLAVTPTSLVIERLTDAEIDIFVDMKTGDGVGTNLQPSQQKRFIMQFDAATQVVEGDDLAVALETIFGVVRAAELLAPA